MKFLEIGAIAILVIVIGCWLVNVYKLTQCDFVLPLKCEIIHGLGIAPPLSIFTVWVDTDK